MADTQDHVQNLKDKLNDTADDVRNMRAEDVAKDMGDLASGAVAAGADAAKRVGETAKGLADDLAGGDASAKARDLFGTAAAMAGALGHAALTTAAGFAEVTLKGVADGANGVLDALNDARAKTAAADTQEAAARATEAASKIASRVDDVRENVANRVNEAVDSLTNPTQAADATDEVDYSEPIKVEVEVTDAEPDAGAAGTAGAADTTDAQSTQADAPASDNSDKQ